MIFIALGYQIIWAVAEGIAVSRFRTRPGEAVAFSGGKGSRLPIFIGLLAASLAVWITIKSATLQLEAVAPWRIAIASALGVLGVTLRVLAIRELGPWFRDTIDIAPHQPRIRSGPYRLLRHPAEIGFISAMAGLFLLAPSVVALGLLAALVALSGYRMVLENRLFPT